MNRTLSRLGFCVATAVALCAVSTAASARSGQWKNAKGETFEADPSDIIGPWALFDDSTLVPLTMFSDEDCVRFQKGLKSQPARADDWKNATSKVSAEVFGRLLGLSADEVAQLRAERVI